MTVARRRRGVVRGALRLLTTTVVLTCVAIAAVPLYGAVTGRYRLLPVLSGSMQPQMARGDLAWVEPRPRTALKVGDVLVFNSPTEGGSPSRRVIHRVTELVDPTTIRGDQVRPNTTYLRTKGDNNADADPWIAAVGGDSVWVRTKVVPDLGRPLLAAGDAGAKVFALFAAALLLVVYAAQTLASAARRSPGPVAPRAPGTPAAPPAEPGAAAARPGAFGVGAVAAAALVVGVAGVAAAVSAALRDDEVTAAAVGAGALTIALDESTLSVSAGDLLPGDEAVRLARLRNDGSIALGALQLEITASGDTGLLAPTAGLQLRVERCSVPWSGSGAGATCPSGSTVVVGDRPLVGRTDLPLSTMAVAVPGGVDHVRLSLRLPDDADPSLAGTSATATVRFLARQRAGAIR